MIALYHQRYFNTQTLMAACKSKSRPASQGLSHPYYSSFTKDPTNRRAKTIAAKTIEVAKNGVEGIEEKEFTATRISKFSKAYKKGQKRRREAEEAGTKSNTSILKGKNALLELAAPFSGFGFYFGSF
ncbi:predicted protein [Sclerotinia sclerotiorum 1980 UF-70]|uniref:Uncharacterized protein n=1 Tax=Sclerotinia sclerotiorum (strain ATCC 18683 / 1980 / Ss-1) TaxID=665079 RepID=A7F828_SCLS1|nr:predicted protein [Sclerotinia sclerotiorum 1980 UF-70]EDN98899.1 predicted protein [Sclerotinia sclerotiorum 1980 UF-70]